MARKIKLDKSVTYATIELEPKIFAETLFKTGRNYKNTINYEWNVTTKMCDIK